MSGEKGQKVVITPGELLRADGTINQEFTGDPHYDVYTLRGGGRRRNGCPASPSMGSGMR